MSKIKVLFMIHDLGQGGAERVLVNLVNNMDSNIFDVTVLSLFDFGENRDFLSKNIRYCAWCKEMIPANSHWMKLLTPQQLHRHIVKDRYDIEIAYLEGPCARIISGCTDPTVKKYAWIHIELHDQKSVSRPFRSWSETLQCYQKFDRIICVSESVKKHFEKLVPTAEEPLILYNTNDTKMILKLAKEQVSDKYESEECTKLIFVGKLLKNKGADRLLSILNQLKREGNKIHLYVLGDGPERKNLAKYAVQNGLESNVTFTGYQLNPYKYLADADLFVCASFAEGFSTAATEALIVGTPVCTVDVAGMKELLGKKDQYGIVVENTDSALYEGIKKLINNRELLSYYAHQAKTRGKDFQTKNTVSQVENFLIKTVEYNET